MSTMTREQLVQAVSEGKSLRGANLRGADLGGADLRGAKGVSTYLTTPLYMLQWQPNPIRAFKIVTENGAGIYRGGLTYEIGKEISVESWWAEKVNTDEHEQCGAGINLATLDWCLREYQPGYRILVVEHNAGDIAAIPVGSDGKYRVRRCKVIEELDLASVGIEAEEEESE